MQGSRLEMESIPQLYQALLDNSAVGITVLDTQGRYLQTNKKFREITGYDSQELRGRDLTELTYPEDRHCEVASFESLMRGETESVSLEKRSIRKDGSLVWVRVTRSLQRDENGHPVYCVSFVEDISQRKNYEEALAAKQEMLDLFVKHTPAAVAMFDREMRYIACSDRWLSDYRLGDQNPLGRSHYEVFPEIEERWKVIHQRCLGGESEKCEEDRFVRLDGSVDWVRWEIHPWFKSAGEVGGIIMFTEVITARRQEQEALRASEAFKKAILDSLPAHVAVVNEKGAVIAVNQSWLQFAKENNICDLHRVTEGADYIEVCRRAADMNDPLAREAMEGIQTVLQGGASDFSMEYPCHSPTRQRWFLMNVRRPTDGIFGAVILHLDITQRVLAETALKESEERLRLAVSAAKEGIWDWDIQTGAIQWSHRYGELFGEPEQSRMLEWWSERIHPDDLERVMSSLEESCRGRETYWVAEYRFRRADGSYAFVLDRAHITRDQAGQPTRVIGAMLDMTELKETEAALRRAKAELERSNHELEQFAYVASHDLQEPLRMISGHLEIVQRDLQGRLDAATEESLKYSLDGAVRMQAMIQDMLSYSRVGTREMELQSVNLRAVVDQVLQGLQKSIEEAQAVINVGQLPTLQADEMQMFQLLQNLLGNAIKFHQEGRRPEIEVGAEPQDGQWLIYVRDNGIGIPPEHHEAVFQTFRRLQPQRKYSGLGMGLAICKRIVDRYGGRIWVESEAGQGATFYLLLPERPVEQTAIFPLGR